MPKREKERIKLVVGIGKERNFPIRIPRANSPESNSTNCRDVLRRVDAVDI